MPKKTNRTWQFLASKSASLADQVRNGDVTPSDALRQYLAENPVKPKFTRSMFLPALRDENTGATELAVPGAVMSLGQSLLDTTGMFKDAYTGKLQVRGPDGRISPEAIARATDAAGLLTLGAGAVPAEANSLNMGIRAYHGSPHSFDKFSMDKIGTGEGAQAYGHGLYFAENEAVAKGYRDALRAGVDYKGGGYPGGAENPAAKHVADMITSADTPIPDVIAKTANKFKAQASYLRKYPERAQTANPEELAKSYDELAANVEKLNPKDFSFSPGHMYQVDINANPEDFLDWDRPLSEQPKKVQDALARFGVNPNEAGQNAYQRAGTMTFPIKGQDGRWGQGGSTYEESLALAGGDPKKVNRLMNGYPTEKSKALLDAGIPGIKYKDAGSRGVDASSGTSNYVIFDDNLVSIVKKYGIVGALSAGLITKEQAQAYQDEIFKNSVLAGNAT